MIAHLFVNGIDEASWYKEKRSAVYSQILNRGQMDHLHDFPLTVQSLCWIVLVLSRQCDGEYRSQDYQQRAEAVTHLRLISALRMGSAPCPQFSRHVVQSLSGWVMVH